MSLLVLALRCEKKFMSSPFFEVKDGGCFINNKKNKIVSVYNNYFVAYIMFSIKYKTVYCIKF